jgi:site-specific recombinase XerD
MKAFAFPDDSAWGRCLSNFLTTCSRSGSEKTLREYRTVLTYFFSEIHKVPDQVTREDVLHFIYAPSRGHRTPGNMPSVATRNVRLAILKSFYSFAASYTIEGPDGHPTRILTTIPPTLGMKASKPEIEYRALSFEDIERIFRVIPTDTVIGARDHCLLLFYLITARRRMEIARLRYGDISPAILIDEHGARRSGFTFVFRGKGHATEHDLQELPLLVKHSLDRYLAVSGRQATIKSGDPLFVSTTQDQGKQLTDTSIARRLKLYARKAGLDESKVSLHSLRHTSARERYMAGEDIRSIQRILRHQNLATTDLYLRALVSTADAGAKLLEKRFGHL